MEMRKVDSKMLSHVGYDEATETLAVTFKGGGTYHYPGVPKDLHEKCCGAESIGSFFAREIRAKYKGTRQDDV
jgi:hypothetical protein